MLPTAILPIALYIPRTAFLLRTSLSLLLPYPKQAGSSLANGRLPHPSTDGKGLLSLPKLPFVKERVPGEPAAGGPPSKQLSALL